MAALVAAIHAFLSECAARRGWPAQGRPWRGQMVRYDWNSD